MRRNGNFEARKIAVGLVHLDGFGNDIFHTIFGFHGAGDFNAHRSHAVRFGIIAGFGNQHRFRFAGRFIAHVHADFGGNLRFTAVKSALHGEVHAAVRDVCNLLRGVRLTDQGHQIAQPCADFIDDRLHAFLADGNHIMRSGFAVDFNRAILRYGFGNHRGDLFNGSRPFRRQLRNTFRQQLRQLFQIDAVLCQRLIQQRGHRFHIDGIDLGNAVRERDDLIPCNLQRQIGNGAAIRVYRDAKARAVIALRRAKHELHAVQNVFGSVRRHAHIANRQIASLRHRKRRDCEQHAKNQCNEFLHVPFSLVFY